MFLNLSFHATNTAHEVFSVKRVHPDSSVTMKAGDTSMFLKRAELHPGRESRTIAQNG